MSSLLYHTSNTYMTANDWKANQSWDKFRLQCSIQNCPKTACCCHQGWTARIYRTGQNLYQLWKYQKILDSCGAREIRLLWWWRNTKYYELSTQFS
jgi:hypothetical protein